MRAPVGEYGFGAGRSAVMHEHEQEFEYTNGETYRTVTVEFGSPIDVSIRVAVGFGVVRAIFLRRDERGVLRSVPGAAQEVLAEALMGWRTAQRQQPYLVSAVERATGVVVPVLVMRGDLAVEEACALFGPDLRARIPVDLLPDRAPRLSTEVVPAMVALSRLVIRDGAPDGRPAPGAGSAAGSPVVGDEVAKSTTFLRVHAVFDDGFPDVLVGGVVVPEDADVVTIAASENGVIEQYMRERAGLGAPPRVVRFDISGRVRIGNRFTHDASPLGSWHVTNGVVDRFEPIRGLAGGAPPTRESAAGAGSSSIQPVGVVAAPPPGGDPSLEQLLVLYRDVRGLALRATVDCGAVGSSEVERYCLSLLWHAGVRLQEDAGHDAWELDLRNERADSTRTWKYDDRLVRVDKNGSRANYTFKGFAGPHIGIADEYGGYHVTAFDSRDWRLATAADLATSGDLWGDLPEEHSSRTSRPHGRSR